MVFPNGSKALNAISTNDFNYLVHDTNNNPAVINGWDSQYFSNKGKPLGNLTTVDVSEKLLVDLRKMLPERKNNINTIFDDYPNLSSPSTDLSLPITQETDIWITFLDEGAGYVNAFGYYLWVYDGDDKIMLQNDDITNGNGSLGNYNPQIIFPNGSLGVGGPLRSGGDMIPGHKRKLLGNLNNGKFNNVNVGFFLVPNAWKNQNQGVVYNNLSILYSDRDFNTGSANNNIQAIIFDYFGQRILGFEDIKRPSGDSDMNDIVLMIETSPLCTGNFINSNMGTISSTCLKKDFFGLFISDPTQILLDSNKTYKFSRRINFMNNYHKKEHNFVMTNINHEISPIIVDIDDNICDYNYTFTSDIINDSIVDDSLKLYLFKKAENENDTNIIISDESGDFKSYNGHTAYDLMVSLQHIELDKITSEHHILQDITNNQNTITLRNDNNASIDNIYGSLCVWGDPHIQTIFGTTITIAHEGVFELFNDNNIIVNTECWKNPIYSDHSNIDFREGTFMKNISFIYNDKAVIVNMNDLSVKLKDNGVLRKYYDYDNDEKIWISDINDYHNNKHVILYYINKDKDSSTRFIHIKDTIFACTLIPNIEGELNAFKVVKCNKELLPSTSSGLFFGVHRQINSLC